MPIDVTQAFTAYSADNRGPTPTNPDAREHTDYGLSAVLAGNVIELTLTFHTGAAYCCGEWQCHFMLFPTRRWHALRRALSDTGVEVPEQLELRVEVHIEDGALFLLPRRSAANSPGLAPSKGYRYEATVTEVDRADADPSDTARGECM